MSPFTGLRCDRCGTEERNRLYIDAWGSLTVRRYPGREADAMDLCPPCADSFGRWRLMAATLAEIAEAVKQ